MNIEVLKDLLSRRPFEPFRVVMSSGTVYEVRHPEMALLFKTGVYIALPPAEGDIPERGVWCALLHVASVEHTTAA